MLCNINSFLNIFNSLCKNNLLTFIKTYIHLCITTIATKTRGLVQCTISTCEDKVAYLQRNDSKAKTVNNWLQNIFFTCINPLLKKADQKWLTAGDAYGFDAQYIQQSNTRQHAETSDLNSDFLEIAMQNGIINNYSVQNAEKLTFQDNTFDYILCKEC